MSKEITTFIQMAVPVFIWLLVYIIALRLKKKWAIILAWTAGLSTGYYFGMWIVNSQ